MKRALVIFVLIFFIGCASVGRQIDQSAADKIEKGKSTKADVIALIGSPDRIIKNNDITIFSYHYARVTSKPETFIPVVGPFVGGHNVQSQHIMITFGPDDIVKNVMSSYSATESNRGMTTGDKPELKDVEENKRLK
jgi:outer membrane protein assembly factor BamE (lipoprotein component of BamABCDE complex)